MVRLSPESSNERTCQYTVFAFFEVRHSVHNDKKCEQQRYEIRVRYHPAITIFRLTRPTSRGARPSMGLALGDFAGRFFGERVRSRGIDSHTVTPFPAEISMHDHVLKFFRRRRDPVYWHACELFFSDIWRDTLLPPSKASGVTGRIIWGLLYVAL
jgi:hypothetical protein